jgi:hypothetical protein
MQGYGNFVEYWLLGSYMHVQERIHQIVDALATSQDISGKLVHPNKPKQTPLV